jgi:esterase/lipase superfamily enzyme
MIMLFITNRAMRQSVRTRKGRKVQMMLDDNSANQHLYFCIRRDVEDYTEIGNEAFMDQLRRSQAKELLFLVHGFNNLPEPSIFPMATTLQNLFDEHHPGMIEVIPLIWPCDNDKGILKDYFDDQRAADASAFAFARALGKFDAWRNKLAADDVMCTKRINLLAHSMGNRVTRGAVKNWISQDLMGHPPLLFRNIFLVAADIRYDSLEKHHPADDLPHICRNLTVYHAADDLALRASKTMNKGNRITSLRMGHKGPRDLDILPNNVYSVDCGDINLDCNPGLGHTYFLTCEKDDQAVPSNAFLHIANTLKTGRVQSRDSHTWDIPKQK